MNSAKKKWQRRKGGELEVGRSAPRSPPRQRTPEDASAFPPHAAAAAAAAAANNPLRRLSRLVPLLGSRKRVSSTDGEDRDDGEDAKAKEGFSAVSTAEENEIRAAMEAPGAEETAEAAAGVEEMAGGAAGGEGGGAAAIAVEGGAGGAGAKIIGGGGGGGRLGLGAAARAAGRTFRPDYAHLSPIHHLVHGGHVAVSHLHAAPPSAAPLGRPAAVLESGTNPSLSLSGDGGGSYGGNAAPGGTETVEGAGVGRSDNSGGGDDGGGGRDDAGAAGALRGLQQPETAGRLASVGGPVFFFPSFLALHFFQIIKQSSKDVVAHIN